MDGFHCGVQDTLYNSVNAGLEIPAISHVVVTGRCPTTHFVRVNQPYAL